MNEIGLSDIAIGGKGDGNSLKGWIKLNVDQTGFYRVKYDEDLAARLIYAIENKYLSATDRFGNTFLCFYSLFSYVVGCKIKWLKSGYV